MKKTRMLCISSLMASLSVVILSMGSLVESLDFSLSLFAGLLVMILEAEYGNRVALSVFGVTSILSFMLPLKTPAIFYFAFFGWYPLLQKKIHFLKPFWAKCVKFLLFNSVMGILLALSAWVTGILDGMPILAVTVVLANLCFFLYDILLDRFLIWYILKLRHRFRF